MSIRSPAKSSIPIRIFPSIPWSRSGCCSRRFWPSFRSSCPGCPSCLGAMRPSPGRLLCTKILHAIDHWPYEWWKNATEHPRLGAFWRLLYGFHLMHHANIGCNEAISGFFGLPVPDWCFGTYHQPEELLLDGRMATARDFAIRNPYGFVGWIDRWARRREAGIMRGPE